MEMTYGGIPIAEVILLTLMLSQLVVLWGSLMYSMGSKEEK